MGCEVKTSCRLCPRHRAGRRFRWRGDAQESNTSMTKSYLSLCRFLIELFYQFYSLGLLLTQLWFDTQCRNWSVALSLSTPLACNNRHHRKESLHLCTRHPTSLVDNPPEKSRQSMGAVADFVLFFFLTSLFCPPPSPYCQSIPPTRAALTFFFFLVRTWRGPVWRVNRFDPKCGN